MKALKRLAEPFGILCCPTAADAVMIFLADEKFENGTGEFGMSNVHKAAILKSVRERVGELHKLAGSNSLFAVGDNLARVYLRYSKVHSGGRTFFGLRDVDLRKLAGHNSYICFYLDDGSTPLFVPYADFEELFHNAAPANDGQYKVQLVSGNGTRELYVPKMGRFNLDGFAGIDTLVNSVDSGRVSLRPELSHSQVQTLLAGIGNAKGFDIFIPRMDVEKLDWSLTPSFGLRGGIPNGFSGISTILSEIDVLWIAAGRNTIEGLFEVEHSTSIYSGLLRFNDVLLTDPNTTRFYIVSDEKRRDRFSRQAYRPTFRQSGLSERTSFLEYANVFDWHQRLLKGKIDE